MLQLGWRTRYLLVLVSSDSCKRCLWKWRHKVTNRPSVSWYLMHMKSRNESLHGQQRNLWNQKTLLREDLYNNDTMVTYCNNILACIWLMIVNLSTLNYYPFFKWIPWEFLLYNRYVFIKYAIVLTCPYLGESLFVSFILSNDTIWDSRAAPSVGESGCR